MMIGLDVASQVLLWSRETMGLRNRIEEEYDVLLHEAAARLCSSEGGRSGDGLRALAGEGTPPEAIRQVVRAPRTASRLLWPRPGEAGRTRRFLRHAFAIERAVLGLSPRTDASGWSADGRAVVRAGGAVVHQPALCGRLPIDTRSPHARSFDLWGGSRMARPARAAPTADVEAATVARLQEAWRGIGARCEPAAECILAWTRVVVAQASPPGTFWSGSNGQYVGRVMLVNADSPDTPVEDVADALVHEAIHGFLYMHESVEPWVLDFSLYTDEPAIVSPWSGNHLPVRPFMQACFVWYGLAMFWAQNLGGTAFDASRACFLLDRALSGFRRGSLADRLEPWRGRVRPEMCEVIDGLQSVVLSLLN